MNFVGPAKRLDDIDLPREAAEIGVGEDELHAVLEVETRGGGFDKKNRPKMLFEPHIFYRQLKSQPDKLQQAVDQGLAYRKWGTRKYPLDSYPRLKAAMLIDAEAALKSSSWALGQIMGFNHALAGYKTVQEMVQAFMQDEELHLRGMINFIKGSGLDDELREHDWAGFARGYNGSGYAKHGYHTKLAKAYSKWQGIKDTPFKVDRVKEIIHAAPKPTVAPGGSLVAALMAAFQAFMKARKG